MVITEVNFQLAGSCQFIDIFLSTHKGEFIDTQIGRLSGNWHWKFEDGIVETTYVTGATVSQVPPARRVLSGIMKINMAQINCPLSDAQLLFLSYKSTEFRIEDNKVTIMIEGQFTGGPGNYVNAIGDLTLVSINGPIEKGAGRLMLKR
ncbi:MAG: hypothetical protein AAGA83_19815 [Cyanobacteria bacterium P01_F01_bin.116]